MKSDGTFRYRGEEYVDRKGDYTGTIDMWRFQQLAKFIKESKFMELDSTYSVNVTDNPTVYTIVVMNGKRKVISNYANSAPMKLWAIEELIDGLLTTAKWNSTSSNQPKTK